jgi:hypothetical protein
MYFLSQHFASIIRTTQSPQSRTHGEKLRGSLLRTNAVVEMSREVLGEVEDDSRKTQLRTA